MKNLHIFAIMILITILIIFIGCTERLRKPGDKDFWEKFMEGCTKACSGRVASVNPSDQICTCISLNPDGGTR